MSWRPFLLALCLTGTACAYYNGLYNANRLADEARQAESQGRRGEARSLWLQAAAKADSVVARYPNSKYRDDALLMSGMAHSRVGECGAAARALSMAVATTDDPAVGVPSRILLARCQLELQQFDSVSGTVGPLIDHPDSRTAEQARTLRGRAALAAGHPGAALIDLSQSSDSIARFDLAAALVATGRIDRAVEELRGVLVYEYDGARWVRLLDALGRQAPEQAAWFVDEWVRSNRLEGEQLARLLLDDAIRWSSGGQVNRAADRYRQAADWAGDSPIAEDAIFRLAELRLRGMDDLAEVGQVAALFGSLSSRAAARYTNLLSNLAIGLRSERANALRLFQLAEVARDSLGVDGLAVRIFERLVRDHPGSAISPKALLAVASLEPHRADSIRSVLIAEYPDSPYTHLVVGGQGAGFAAVEDSLRRSADTLRPRRVPWRPRSPGRNPL